MNKLNIIDWVYIIFGIIIILCHIFIDDLFIVVLVDNKYTELQRINDVYFDCLVNVIDEAVERTSDYEERVRNEYNN